MTDADQKVLEHLGEEAIEKLQSEVARVSSKLFCLTHDLQKRIPLSKAVDLVKLYRKLMQGCGGDYLDDRQLCYSQYELDKVSGDPTLTDLRFKGAREKKDVCMAGARQNKKDCAALLVPKMQVLRSEIKSSWKELGSDAKAVQRWLEMEATALSKISEEVMANLQKHVDKMNNLADLRSRQRSTLTIEHGSETQRMRRDDSTVPPLDETQRFFLDLLGFSDFVSDESTETNGRQRRAALADDDESNNECDAGDFGEWMNQCPDICVPFCCPRMGCCSGCKQRSSCSQDFFSAFANTPMGQCMVCISETCSSNTNDCLTFEEPAAEAPVWETLPADVGITAYGPTVDSSTQPDSYQILIRNIVLCSGFFCDGSTEGPTGAGVECRKGQVRPDPNQCITIWDNVDLQKFKDAYGPMPLQERLGTDELGYTFAGGACEWVRKAQAAGLYTELVGNGVHLDFTAALSNQDTGNYTYIAVNLDGDVIVKATIPVSSGVSLHTQPCGCDSCPNQREHSSTGAFQHNDDVMCGGGGCSACNKTAIKDVFTGGATANELGMQKMMCKLNYGLVQALSFNFSAMSL